MYLYLPVPQRAQLYYLIQLGKSQEDIQAKHSESEDEFEQSLEEILERELEIDSDKEIGKVEVSEMMN